jgi:hypothetical protein
MPIIATRASAAYGAGFSRVVTAAYAGPFGAYDSLATLSPSGSTGTITFTGIPSGYKHLQLRVFLKGTSGSGGYPTASNFYFNNDSTVTNYRNHVLNANGATVSAGGGVNYDALTYAPGSDGAYTNMYMAGIIDILDYADTSKNTTVRSMSGLDANGSGQIRFVSMLWKNTAAVNRFDIVADPIYLTNWTTASKISLYGVK